MKILIAPNSFKECADSVKIADIFASGLSGLGNSNLIIRPVSDGGDGFLNVCNKIYGLQIRTYKIPAPFSRKTITCHVGYNKKDKKLFIESANVLGLNLIPKDKRHPLYLSSRGMGVLLKNILTDISNKELAVDKIIIGIGGTGTNDMGIGMLSELGMQLLDEKGRKLKPLPANFNAVKKVIWEKIKIPFEIELVVDVDNRLLGSSGATSVFGRQKGLTAGEIKIANAGFENLIGLSKRGGFIKGNKFISGAGGGLAAGFQLFLNANMILSDKFVSVYLKTADIKKLSAVVTGEGAFDGQSFMNKAAGTIIKMFAGRPVKIFLVCGVIDKRVKNILPANVYPIEISDFFKRKKDSIRYYEKGILKSCENILTVLKRG